MPLFRKHGAEEPPAVPKDPPGWVRRSVALSVDPVRLSGDLVVPEAARAIVVFAHGSGSSRRSPRNIEVADRLNGQALGTLLFDLLTEAEAEDGNRAFDVGLLASRLEAAARWVWRWPALGGLPVGFFGASTGAAAALVAAAKFRAEIAAVVSRGGRPDLASDALERVTAPTLLIVGGNDIETLASNSEALERMRCEKRLEVIDGAGHLFEEPEALARVADLAGSWFAHHTTGARGGRRMLPDVI